MVDKSKFLKELGLENINQGSCTGTKWVKSDGKTRKVSSPVDGKVISSVVESDDTIYEEIISTAQKAFLSWRKAVAPDLDYYTLSGLYGDELYSIDTTMIVRYDDLDFLNSAK